MQNETPNSDEQAVTHVGGVSGDAEAVFAWFEKYGFDPHPSLTQIEELLQDISASRAGSRVRYKNVVWRVQGGESYDIDLNINAGHGEPYSKVRRYNGRLSGLMQFPFCDWSEAELLGEPRADASTMGSGVNLAMAGIILGALLLVTTATAVIWRLQ